MVNTREVLTSWATLNEFLRNASVEECEELKAAELEGKRRLVFLLRIHSRFNKERAAKERRQLKSMVVAK